MKEKIETLAKLLEEQQKQELIKRGFDCSANLNGCKVTVHPGTKYTKVDVGGSGKLMIDSQGNIFGIKGYGVVHRGHQYGTLDTINDYYWGGYYPTKKT